jgi:hypothetical protein
MNILLLCLKVRNWRSGLALYVAVIVCDEFKKRKRAAINPV